MGVRDSLSEFRCFKGVVSFRTMTKILALYFTAVISFSFSRHCVFIYLKDKAVRELVGHELVREQFILPESRGH